MWPHDEPHPGAYLRHRYLEPLGLTPSQLADACHLPRSRVSSILTGQRRITADTALRFARFFRMDPQDWMALQAAWDLAQAEDDERVQPLDPPGFLIGPRGAQPFEALRRQLAAEDEVPYDASHREVTYADGTRALVAVER